MVLTVSAIPTNSMIQMALVDYRVINTIAWDTYGIIVCSTIQETSSAFILVNHNPSCWRYIKKLYSFFSNSFL